MKTMTLIPFKRKDILEISKLFHVIWSGNIEKILSKTRWAFDGEHAEVVLAKNENEEIVAVRGGFKWPLTLRGGNINAIQLHGTCVRPDYQRQGLFTKLTQLFIEKAQTDNIELIFNVSVDKSRLGYEKLGWIYYKGFRRLSKLHMASFVFSPKSLYDGYVNEKRLNLIADVAFEKRKEMFEGTLHTQIDLEFFKWRIENKKEDYKILEYKGSFIIYKIQNRKQLRELIIGELFLIENSMKVFTKLISMAVRVERPHLSTTYIFNSHPLYRKYLFNGFLINPFNYNLNFGVKRLSGSLDFSKEKLAFGYIDIDTF